MIKTLFKAAIIAAFCAAPAAGAYEPEGWRADAPEIVKKDIAAALEVKWSQSISLWVTVRGDGTRRDGLAEVICFSLDRAGRPQGEFVAVEHLGRHKRHAHGEGRAGGL